MTISKILISGKPGCGKSTLVMRIVDALKEKNVTIGGIITPEFRQRGVRTGFKICNLLTAECRIMASKLFSSPTRVGRYGVDLHVIETFGCDALRQAYTEAQVIVIDEIGKMELLSDKFQQVLYDLLKSDKLLLATVGLALLGRIESKLREYDKQYSKYILQPKNWAHEFTEILSLLSVALGLA